MTTIPGKYDFTIYQGSDFSTEVTFLQSEGGDPVDLTDLTMCMHIRRTKNSVNFLAELTTENGGIITGNETGIIELLMTSVQTASLTSGGVFDLEVIFSPTSRERWLEGAITLSKEVTKNG